MTTANNKVNKVSLLCHHWNLEKSEDNYTAIQDGDHTFDLCDDCLKFLLDLNMIVDHCSNPTQKTWEIVNANGLLSDFVVIVPIAEVLGALNQKRIDEGWGDASPVYIGNNQYTKGHWLYNFAKSVMDQYIDWFQPWKVEGFNNYFFSFHPMQVGIFSYINLPVKIEVDNFQSINSSIIKVFTHKGNLIGNVVYEEGEITEMNIWPLNNWKEDYFHKMKTVKIVTVYSIPEDSEWVAQGDEKQIRKNGIVITSYIEE